MNRLKLAVAAIAFAAVAVAYQADLDAKVRSETVEKLAETMISDYVFPDLGKQIAEDLRARLKRGEYDSLKDGTAFAKKLSDDMRLIAKDAHLNVRYSDKALPPRTVANEPSAEEVRREKERARQLNAGYEKVERLIGNVGYLEVRGFFSPEEIQGLARNAIEFLANTDALIIDLRRNGGGDPEGVQLLCSYLFKDRVHLNSLYFRPGNRTDEFWTKPELPGPRYEKPVYVLVSKRTGSGAEEFAYNLQNLKRATIIGEPTWGGANPGGFVRLNDHFGAFIPIGRAINPYTKTNWEGTGVIPEERVDPKDGLLHAHRLAVQKMLEQATDAQDRERLQSVLKELGG